MRSLFLLVAALPLLASAALSRSVDVPTVGKVTLSCDEPNGWSFVLTPGKTADGVGQLKVNMKAEKPTKPPTFKVFWKIPMKDIHHFWSAQSTHYGIPWDEPHFSELSSWMPIYQFQGTDDGNRWTFATSEARRTVDFRAPIAESDCTHRCAFRFFVRPEAPMTEYETAVRFDPRYIPYGEALAAASDWISAAPENAAPMVPPAEAFDPLYSSWYGFHQTVTGADVERECAIAAKLGMKTVIVDDGWQIDREGGHNGYRLCGDWKPARRFTDDMKAHVARVKAMGMKYVLWYSVPFVGEQSSNFERFKGKYLPKSNSCAGGWALDPRFPEVREFLIETYERAVREWDIDGFKLDFIGRFTLKEGTVDPAIAENWKGRDILSIPAAVDRLLTDVMKRLKAIKPDILIEFRQPYVGPSIRKYGNMLRASDCPCSMVENRTRIARMRLVSGGTAIHADMLEWPMDETPENVSRCILNAIFGVVQYSVRLAEVPEAHTRVIRNWLDFSVRHRDALLKGKFTAHDPAGEYPVLEGESVGERVIGVYRAGQVVRTGNLDRRVFVMNATDESTIVVELPSAARAKICDAYGKQCAEREVPSGLSRLSVPVGGLAEISGVDGRD